MRYAHITTLGITALLVAASAGAGTLAGRVTAGDGKPVAGAMVTLADDTRGIAESVYTDADGSYTLTTRRIDGTLRLRVREPYCRDATGAVTLDGDARVVRDVALERMVDAKEISDSLPAAFHFGQIKFEQDGHFTRDQFQRDCLSCHQLGNEFTRAPRPAEAWAFTVQRMHGYLGNKDMEAIAHRAGMLATAFDGQPLTVRPEFPFQAATAIAHVTQYRLDKAVLPHDAEVSPNDGRVYIADQFGDQMIVTDRATGESRYVPVNIEGMNAGGRFAKLGIDALGEAASKLYRGPHSLALGPDGRWYTTDTFATHIGAFNPKTMAWEPSYEIPGGLYPHTIRFDPKGRVWFTLAFSDQLGRLDPVSGKFAVINVPKRAPTGLAGGTMPYGIDVNPVDGSIWYARLFGDVIGRVDPETLEIAEFDSPVRGPRRMRFGRDGTLWISGYSDGVVAAMHTDGTQTPKSEVFRMPEFAPGYRPAAYALAVSPHNGDVWVAETMTDRLYRFEPASARWSAYPMPLRGTYTREVSFAASGEVCTSNNPFPAAALEGGHAELVCIDPGR